MSKRLPKVELEERMQVTEVTVKMTPETAQAIAMILNGQISITDKNDPRYKEIQGILRGLSGVMYQGRNAA